MESEAVAPQASGNSKADKPAAGGLFSSAAATPAGADNRVMMGQDIEIFAQQPRPDLASADTQAFEAKDRRLPGEQFVLLCRTGRVPAVTAIGSYRNLKSPHILKLVQAGIIDWKPEGRQRLALVFEKPHGGRLLAEPNGRVPRVPEDRIVQSLIVPVLEVLQEFRTADMAHGGICLENIFISNIEQGGSVTLGECISSASLFRQHPAYLTVERGMAQAQGRGIASFKDDLYALGICTAMLLRGVNLMAEKKPAAVLLEKIEQGSLAFATGGERLPAIFQEFLRGVLNDDETQRWDLDDALRWSEGRRIASRQQHNHPRAARPFVFREDKFWDLRSIAHAFSQHVAEAAAVLEKDQFSLWIKRNFEDKLLATRLQRAWEREKGSGKERLVANVCMALDPQAPVRFRDVAIYPDGFGAALAEVTARQEDVQVYGELVAAQMFSTWLSQRAEEGKPDENGLIGQFEKCRSFLVQKMPVYGIERVLYMMNREVACMSPVLLQGHVVLSPGDLLLALEDISRKGNRPEHILDRHMMAFISVREPKMIDPHLGHVISRDAGNQMVGIARTLAAIQRRFSTGPVPGLSAWLISLLAPAIERFNDRDLRGTMQSRLAKLSDSGDLGAILALIDNGPLAQEDTQRFALARREYAGLLVEQDAIQRQLQRRKTFGRSAGRQVAMLVSVSLSGLCVLGYIILKFSGGDL